MAGRQPNLCRRSCGPQRPAPCGPVHLHWLRGQPLLSGSVDALGALSPGDPLDRAQREPFRGSHPGRRLLATLSGGDGRGHGLLWFRWTLPCLRSGPEVFRRAVGVTSHVGHLVRKFPTRVHVLQSVLVTCPFGLCCLAVSLVLAPYARRAHAGSVDAAGWTLGVDGQRILSERLAAGDPRERGAHHLRPDLAARAGSCGCRAAAWSAHSVCGCHRRCAPAHACHALGHLREPVSARVSRAMVLDLPGAEGCALLLQPRASVLDTNLDSCPVGIAVVLEARQGRCRISARGFCSLLLLHCEL